MAAKFVTYGFKEWLVACDPNNFKRVLTKHMTRATELNGMIGVRAQRDVIQSSRGLAANAVLTRFIKGSEKPIVNHGDLFGSITYEVINEFTVFVGVLRSDETGFNIATAIHEGFELRVTPAMRGMFLYLWKVGEGELPASALTGRAAELWAIRPGKWLPLSDDTQVIVTPPRPWATIAFDDAGFKLKIATNWSQALEATFKELAGKGTKTSNIAKLAKKVTKKAKKAAKSISRAGKGLSRQGKKAARVVSKQGKKGSKIAKRIAKRTSKALTKRIRATKRAIKRGLK